MYITLYKKHNADKNIFLQFSLDGSGEIAYLMPVDQLVFVLSFLCDGCTSTDIYENVLSNNNWLSDNKGKGVFVCFMKKMNKSA